MTQAAAAQAQLVDVVEELEAINSRLTSVLETLPQDPSGAGEEEMDVSIEIRSVIECVLTDSLGPAIRDLQAAASYHSGEGGDADPSK